MSDVSHIKCPNCQHEFAPSDAYKEQMASELRQQMQKWKQEAEDKFKKRENELTTQFQETMLKNQKEQEEQLRKRIASDF